jgi:hypothetical protein
MNDNNSPIFLKQMAIRKMAVDMAIPEKIVELVIAHSFKQAHRAFRENASIEICGFGRFVTRPLLTERERVLCNGRIEHFKKQLEDPLLTNKRRISRLGFIDELEGYLKVIEEIQRHEV